MGRQAGLDKWACFSHNRWRFVEPLGGESMSYVISDKCTKCGSCAPVCPQEAIAEGDKQYVIDAEKCVDCGLCAGECPVEAISPA
jgi:NAD-dependent dihydropyrimidine dehydrogenase PreA subunit